MEWMKTVRRVHRRHLFTRYGFPLIALVMLVFAIISTFPDAAATIPAPDAPPPTSLFAKQIAGIGVTEPKSESIAIGTNISGIVTAVNVSVGQQVAAGDVLFVIDDRATKAALATARVQAADSKAQLGFYTNVSDKRAISRDELSRRKFAAQLAEARVNELEVELERLSVKAPIDGTILSVDVRAGEFAPIGQSARPLMRLGDISTMHVRVEVDESEALLVKNDARAIGRLRGYAEKEANLTLVRKEFFVRPKRSLTGDGNERVDTRVQELVYAFDNSAIGTFVGQQMDVYIEATAQ